MPFFVENLDPLVTSPPKVGLFLPQNYLLFNTKKSNDIQLSYIIEY